MIIDFEQNVLATKELQELSKKIAKETVKQLGLVEPEFEFSLCFVDKERMRLINFQTMEEDKPTDVLAFPFLEFGCLSELVASNFPLDLTESGNIFLGDVVVCLEIAASQALEMGHSEQKELAILITHGILHLLGFTHYESDDTEQMFALQDKIVASVL
ncbi:MAG: rRNA maturation RNase YbeY [Firmicutes bacterium]|nr:rRNA maturation RNase YbeY [Bacillota bacterium]